MPEGPEATATPSRKRPAPDDTDSHNAQPALAKDSLDSPHSSDALSTPKSIESPRDSPVAPDNAPPNQASPTSGNSKSTAVEKATASSGPTPAKRRKFTPEEKEQQRLDKEAKLEAREKLKAQKEEEAKKKNELKEEKKRAKEQEKAQKDEEQRKKDEKKRAKEQEKAQKEEEQRKKEKSQMKLNSFFTKNAAASSSSDNAAATSTVGHVDRRKSVSLEPKSPSARRATTPQNKQPVSDYERTFLPFELPSHATRAPDNYYWADCSDRELEEARKRLDSIAGGSISEDERRRVEQALKEGNFAALVSLPAALQGKRGQMTPAVQEVVARLQGSQDEPIDLTQESSEAKAQQPLELLKSIPIKYLHFGEDVRPPYCGTFTRVQSEHQSRKLARNPFSRTLPEANYEYDSEAEWEEPEEGDDLDLEDEDDAEEEGDDDLDGFLDDDDDPVQNRRKLITGDLEPISTGICWEDSKGALRRGDGSGAQHNFADYRMGILLEPCPTSIDPFTTAYWQTEPTSAPTSAPNLNGAGMMHPPRLPLHSRPDGVNGASVGFQNQLKVTHTTPTVPKPAKRTIPPELMTEFKDAIRDSDLTKLALIEALKKKFPKIPKDAITNTLSLVAERVGPKNTEKRWTIRET
ncbi:uncharacterized protein K452DRAFT_327633 [Aplosporella prunicola CBS 121167]|uniref:Chromatin assembly factor 1 subunit A n=1 Tax=Aplosporella prunicola CBS 121167 TaxID=1176127 RepID=A0A6A6B7R5_9PEZI|nr:uncharacterized protein K452DRAFT_327633 [Aplosporella prunicola CBS 121167]KAF2140242.1 hypothetical protein K452DRAFT_327633 [Aplosporella prunicola CBS 121167]